MTTNQKHLWEYDHPYYANESNYYCNRSNDPGSKFASWQEFLDEFGNADKDYNLLIRWDWVKTDPRGDYDGPTPLENEGVLQMTYVYQRKGIYAAHFINVTDDDEPPVREFIAGYWEHMQKVWEGS